MEDFIISRERKDEENSGQEKRKRLGMISNEAWGWKEKTRQVRQDEWMNRDGDN